MRRKLGSVVSAAVILLVFTVLPLYAPRLIPPEMAEVLNWMDFDLTPFLNQVALIGFALAILTLATGFVSKASPVFLLASIASSTVMFGLTLVSLSLGDLSKLGDLGSLGMSSITLEVGGGLNTLVLDLRLFIQLSALTVALKIVHSVLEFIDARTGEAQTAESTGQ